MKQIFLFLTVLFIAGFQTDVQAGEMKTLSVRKYVVTDSHAPATTTDAPDRELTRGLKELNRSLRPLGFKAQFGTATLAPAVAASNKIADGDIWIDDQPLEHWMKIASVAPVADDAAPASFAAESFVKAGLAAAAARSSGDKTPAVSTAR